MKISHNWLNDYIDLSGLSIEEVSDHLTLLGLEVDSVEKTGGSLEGVVVGYVQEVRQHPNADRLRLCQVDIGEDESVQIVCGASNVAAGQKVPVATVGTTLPVELEDGKFLKIKKGKLRGQVSMGMICAEDELGLGGDHSGIMVFEDQANQLKPGTPINQVIEQWEDSVYEIELTPNRPDATCHLGVARDLSAKLKRPLKKVSLRDGVQQIAIHSQVSANTPDITIEATELCNRYAGIRISGVKIGESPSWIKHRLESAGLRSINNVVDATNFVMLALGQPMHAFDFNKLDGGKIVVKTFDTDIKFTTLDDEDREVGAGSLFICDASKAVAIAGVMGGLHSEVDDQTTELLLESAYFDPVSVRKTSKALALQTDSSYRFERGIDPNGCMDAALYCAQLIIEIAGGQIVGDAIDVYPVKHGAQSLKLRPSFANQILGLDLNIQQMAEILEGLEFGVEQRGEELFVSVPTFRPDISREIDLVEEIIRVYDLNAIPKPNYGHLVTPAPLPKGYLFKEEVKRLAVGLGFQEIYTNSLLPEDKSSSNNDTLLRTMNPISSEMTVLRDQLQLGMLQSVAHNYNRLATGVRFFEMGNIFRKVAEALGTYHKGVEEQTLLQLSISGQSTKLDWKNPEKDQDFFDLKSAVYSLLAALGLNELDEEIENGILHLKAGKNTLAKLYAIDSNKLKAFKIKKAIYSAEIPMSSLMEHGNLKKSYKAIPKFPPFELDLAFMVDKSFAVGAMAQTIREVTKNMLADLRIFDIYEGDRIEEGKKSIAFRLVLQSDTTLTSKQIDPIIKKIAKKAAHEHQAELRDA